MGGCSEFHKHVYVNPFVVAQRINIERSEMDASSLCNERRDDSWGPAGFGGSGGGRKL